MASAAGGPRVLVVGDTFVDILAGPLERLPRWGKDTVSEGPIRAVAGGSAANTAQGLRVLLGGQAKAQCFGVVDAGGLVQLFSSVGDDIFADVVRQAAVKRGVQLREATDVPPGHPTGTCMVLSGVSDRAFVSHYGISDLWGCDEISVGYLRKFDHVHIGGYFACARMRATLRPLLLRAAAAGCTVSLDTNDDWSEEWDPKVCKDILPLVDIFLPNDREAIGFASSYTGGRVSTVDAALEVLAPLVRGCTIVTVGSEGAVGRSHDGSTFAAPAPKLHRIVDAVGAGDAFNAAFLACYISGTNLETAAAFGCANASFAVMQRGAAEILPGWAELRHFCTVHNHEPATLNWAVVGPVSQVKPSFLADSKPDLYSLTAACFAVALLVNAIMSSPRR